MFSKTRKMGVELFFECVGENPQQLGIILILIGIFMAVAKFLQVLGTLLVLVGSALIFNHVRSKKTKRY